MTKELFETVYGWGRVGLVVDETAPTYQRMIEKIKRETYQKGLIEGILQKQQRVIDAAKEMLRGDFCKHGSDKIESIACLCISCCRELDQALKELEGE